MQRRRIVAMSETMIKYMLMIIIYGAIGIASVSALGFSFIHRREKPLNDGDIIYYLSNDRIYRIVMPNNKKADMVFESPKETKEERYHINGLTCGPDDTLLFHLVHSPKHVTDFSKPSYRITVVTYSLQSREFLTLVDLSDTSVEFPVLSA